MGKLTNLNPPTPIADTDLPASIARDAEFIAADTAHLNATDPHPIYPLKSSFISFGDIPTANITTAFNFIAGGATAAQRAQNGAFFCFHRPGITASFLGLSIFNDLRFGGGNNPGASWRVWHESYGVPVWQAPSDSRLKRNIRPIPSALSLMLEAKPISFEYRAALIGEWGESRHHRKKIHYGFAAEEFPISDLVSVKDNGFLGLDYLEIIPFLVRAIQELHAEIESLKAGKI